MGFRSGKCEAHSGSLPRLTRRSCKCSHSQFSFSTENVFSATVQGILQSLLLLNVHASTLLFFSTQLQMQTISLIRTEYIDILMGLIFLGSPCMTATFNSLPKDQILDVNNFTIPHFDALKIYSCGKHCEKRRIA